jgi:hypothetical protein
MTKKFILQISIKKGDEMKKTTLLAIALLCAMNAIAQPTYYVSNAKGSNKNNGSKTAPFKNIQKAMNVAEDGDVIMVAQGVYYGLLNAGYLEMKKPVKLIGGYSDDFSTRDVIKYAAKIQPPASSNGTARNYSLLTIAVTSKNAEILVDGFIFDRGESNGYHPNKGKPEEFEMGMLMHPPAPGINGAEQNVTSVKMPLIGGRYDGNMTIQNCTFTNSAWYAIQLAVETGKLTIKNNVFVANAMSACEVRGASAKTNVSKIEFCYNTALFTWSRTSAFEDMGYGFRYMTGIDADVHHNIIGLSCLSGLDRTYVDSDKSKEAARVTTAEYNIFFMNKQADLTLPGSGKFLRIRWDMFDDVEQLAKSSGNIELENPTQLKNVINKLYLQEFLNTSYKESADFDPNSPANVFRSAMGINQVGKISTTVGMYANKYPLDDAVKLFGAINGYGVQKIK